MVEKELGVKELWLWLSEVHIETQHRGERDCCCMRDSCQFTSGPFLRRSIVPSSRSYVDSSGWTHPAAPPPEESAYDESSEQWSVGEMTWTRSELTHWNHLSRMLRRPEFVVASDVKRSTGGSITTSWNGHSATYRNGERNASAKESIFSPPCILRQLQLSNWGA
jgi:hypothetical protein